MRFMMLMIPKGYENAAADVMPDTELVMQMMAYNKQLAEAGVLLALDGLHPPSAGARISLSNGTPKAVDGPFAEAKEVVGGYWMLEVTSKEEAVAWALRCPLGDGDVIEVRRVHEMTEFPPDVQAAAQSVLV